MGRSEEIGHGAWLRTDAMVVLFYMFVMVGAVGALLALVRLMGVEWIGHVDKLINPAMLFLAFVYILRKPYLQRPDGLTIILCFMIALGVVVGLAHGIRLRFFASHVFVASFMLILYFSAYNADWSGYNLDRLFNSAADILLLTHALAILSFWVLWGLNITRYIGFACDPLLLSLSYYLVAKRKGRLLFTVALILISGKRGVYLGLLTILSIHAFRRKFRSFHQLILSVLISVILFFVMLVLISGIWGDQNFPVIGSILSKMKMLNPFDPSFNPKIATSGRTIELTHLWELFSSSSWHYLTGLGYGWSFAWSTATGPMIEQNYTHITWLNYFFQYGVVVSTLFLGALYWKFSRFFQLVRSRRFESVEYAVLLTLAGKFAVGLTAYGLSRDGLVWILLGILEYASRQADERIPLPDPAHLEYIAESPAG